MPESRRGRKPKAKRNITGLRNQRAPKPLESTESNADCAQSPEICLIDEISDDDPDQDWDPLLELDSLKPCWRKEDQESDEETVDSDDENMEVLTEGWPENDGIDEAAMELRHIKLMELAIANEDDPRDEEWVPTKLRKKYLRKIKEHKGTVIIL
ncbi:hypothetical protein C0992_004994 [Termitomyces sp. T32_za158]|nr:hypothetical protein C0992_004994 [Termitomyces sp. T32_za158]